MKEPIITDPDILRFPHPVLKSSSLKKGIRQITLLGKNYVLYRDEKGHPVAVPDKCPHRGAKLSKGKVNAQRELVCPYHAWRIKPDGSAQSPSVPSKGCKVHSLKTWDRHGFIWIANSDVTESAFPEFINPEYELIDKFSSSFKAPLKVALVNFGEIEHAFKVHTFIGPNEKELDTVKFTVKVEEDRTYGYLACKYRPMPPFFGLFYGFKKDDYYHNDWVFKFRPLHGSYVNYWTGKDSDERRPISFIITSFLVPVNDNEVNVQVFVQMSIKNRWLRLLGPMLKSITIAITRYEIYADSKIAKYASEDPEVGAYWKLTHYDKQIMPNRKLMDSIYFSNKKEEAVAMESVV